MPEVPVQVPVEELINPEDLTAASEESVTWSDDPWDSDADFDGSPDWTNNIDNFLAHRLTELAEKDVANSGDADEGKDYASEWRPAYIEDPELGTREFARVEGQYAAVLPKVEQSLAEAETVDEVITYLKKVDDLFMGRWEGAYIPDRGPIYYDDSPVESAAYCYLMNKTFLPALQKVEEIGANSPKEERDAINSKLSEYVTSDYEGTSWYLTRASDITTTMLNVSGAEALSQIAEVSDVLTNATDTEEMNSLIQSGFYPDTLLEYSDPEYRSFHSQIVEGISDYPWEDDESRTEAAMFLTKFVSSGSEGNLRTYVAAFEDLGSEKAVPGLLENLKSENILARRMSAEILFRLELGKIGVTEHGAEYLGKLYDLGKYNDPDFFVRRLNNSGLMAVLSEQEGDIEGVFPLDLYAEADTVHAEVRQLMSQELFLPKADETPEERAQREEYTQLFLHNYENIFNDDFFEGTGVRLNSLDLHEQGWFLLSYLELSEQEDVEEEMARLKGFVTRYGEYGLKSFLALEYGGSGQEILDFADSPEVTEAEKQELFRNFNAIATEAFTWRSVFAGAEVVADGDVEFAPQVHEAFLRKNAEFFKAAQLIAQGESGGVSMPELLESMRSITSAMEVLKGLYQEESALGLDASRKNAVETASEYKDAEKTEKVEAARKTWYLADDVGDKVKVMIRPDSTYTRGITGARINFDVNLRTGNEVRIAFDVSHYYEQIGQEDAKPVVSLDLGVKYADRENPRFASQNVSEVLQMVEDSEGGHNEASFVDVTSEDFSKIARSYRSYMDLRYS